MCCMKTITNIYNYLNIIVRVFFFVVLKQKSMCDDTQRTLLYSILGKE